MIVLSIICIIIILFIPFPFFTIKIKFHKHCLSYLSIAITKLRGQGYLQRKAFNGTLSLEDESRTIVPGRGERGSRQAGRHGAGAVVGVHIWSAGTGREKQWAR